MSRAVGCPNAPGAAKRVAVAGGARPKMVAVPWQGGGSTDDPDRARIIAAVRAGASAYVVGPVTRERLAPVLDAAIARFEQLQAARAEAAAAKVQLDERNLVERAKGILMKSRKLSEEDAYRAMRKQAMDRKLKLTEVARQIIALADLLA